MTDRRSLLEVFYENSCTFYNTQLTLISGTTGMELKELYIVPSRKSWGQSILTAYQGVEK